MGDSQPAVTPLSARDGPSAISDLWGIDSYHLSSKVERTVGTWQMLQQINSIFL